jgi:outer membrane protein assembly factor BamA
LAGLALLLLLEPAARAQLVWPQKIRQIRVFENTRTDSATVIELAAVAEGDEFTPDQLAVLKKRLIHAGLFSDVNVYYEPYADGIRLTIIAHDKFAWFVAPTFSAARGNVGGGLAFGHTNLFGRNKRLLAYGGAFTADSRLLVAYQDPSISGSRMFARVDVGLVRSKIDEFNLDLSNSENLNNPQLFRKTPVWQSGGGLQLGINLPGDLRASFYYRVQDIRYEKACTTPSCSDDAIASTAPLVAPAMQMLIDQPGPDGIMANLHLELAYDSFVNLWGVKTGSSIGGWYEIADRLLGSDFHYWKVGGGARHGLRFFEEHNLLFRGGFALGSGLPFTEEMEAGGGGLRGFNYREFRGDTSIDGHIEYFIPIVWAWQMALRGLVFYDSQAVWFRHIENRTTLTPGGTYRVDHDDGTYRTYLPELDANGLLHAPSQGLDRDHWHNGVGSGLRLYLKAINIPLLGFDFGYGIESREVRFYVALGLTD